MIKTTVVQTISETGFKAFESRDFSGKVQTKIIKLQDPLQWSDEAMSNLFKDVMGVQDGSI